MSSEEIDDDDDDDGRCPCGLFHLLPPEIWLNLFGYMSIEFIIEKLSRVCKPLRQFILSSQSFWKYRYERRVRAPYRSLPSTNSTWLKVCHRLERIGHEWQQCAEQHQNILSISGAHIGPITDTILLEDGYTCVTGSRDSKICCWDLRRLVRPEETKVSNASGSSYVSKYTQDQQQRWIWSLDHERNILSSTSSNSEIRLWDLNEEMHEISRIKLQSTFAMTHRLRNSLLYAGVYNGHLHVYDTRINNTENNNSRVHLERVTPRGYIHALEVQDNYILAMHKPSTLCLYDQRTWQKVENVQLNLGERVSSFYKDSLLFLGDNEGFVHVFNWKKDHCEFVEKIRTEHTCPITALYHSQGILQTCTAASKILAIDQLSTPIRSLARIVADTFDQHLCMAGNDYGLTVIGGSDNNLITVYRDEFRRCYTL
jgi:WD40 repeat protein